MADLLVETQERYRDALEALSEQRAQVEEDIAFSDPADPQQWDVAERQQREGDPGGKRPCLVFDQISQYHHNVVGLIEQRPPSIHTVPVGDGADREAATELDGHLRAIEYASRAQLHYMRAAHWQGRTGCGYLIVRPEYTNRAMGYQEPRISSAHNPLSVVFDPWSTEIDGSDATDGWLQTPLSQREFKRRWPKADPISFGDVSGRMLTDARDSVMVVEAWRKVSKTVNMIFAVDLQTGESLAIDESDFWDRYRAGEVIAQPDSQGRDNYLDKRTIVKWACMSGAAPLELETEYPAEHIGIVPVYGYTSTSNGRLSYCGMYRKARNPQRAYNWHMSEARAFVATAAKAPWVMPESALDAAYKKLWDRASIEQRAYLPYRDWDSENNRQIQAPQRAQTAVNLSNHEAGAAAALRDIQSALGMYAANLGAPSNETSGVAIDSRKAQGEASTSLFPGNLEASVAQCGRITIDMTKRLADTRREVMTMGIDGTPGKLILDPEGDAFSENEGANSINPAKGTYGVRVVVGAAYTTQREQAGAAMTELMRNQAMAPIVAPFWARTLDFPNADQLAQAFAEMAPAPVKALLQPTDKGPTSQQLQAQLDQIKQALKEAVQHAQEAQQEVFEVHQELQQKRDEEETRQRELQIKEYEAETKRLQVTGANEAQVQAIVTQMLQDMARTQLPTESLGADGSMQHESAEGEQPELWEMQPMPAQMGEPTYDEQSVGSDAPLGVTDQ